jgi:hypothetical protein
MSAVFVGMMLGRFSRVMGSVLSVPMRHVSVMTGLLVISTLVVLGSFTMVFRCVLVMFSRLVMMPCSFVSHFGCLSMSSFAGQSHLSRLPMFSTDSADRRRLRGQPTVANLPRIRDQAAA